MPFGLTQARGGGAFNERKATQLAALLLQCAGGHMRHIKLIKLIYVVDRMALERRGFAVSGDRYYNLPKGPIVSEILNLVKGTSAREEGIWADSITWDGKYDVALVHDPGRDELAEFEVDLVNEVMDTFGGWDWGALLDYCHDLPEWVAPNPDEYGEARLPLPAERILEVLHKPSAQIEHHRRRAQAEAFLASLG